MQKVTEIPLKDAKPSDRPHLLLWDTPNTLELWELAYYNNAHRVDYRTHLLSRIDPNANFLLLHKRLDRELAGIREISLQSPKPIVILENLDCLITYLMAQPNSPINLFWQKLIDLNHLERLLWMVLPSKLPPHNWPESRIQRFNTQASLAPTQSF